MKARRIITIAFVATALAIASGRVHAQDAMPPMPDTTYGPQDPGAYQSPGDLTVPLPDLGPVPSVVTIPIPGGGQVSVEGPDAPADQGIPTNPGGQWGVQQQAPASQGVGGIGP